MSTSILRFAVADEDGERAAARTAGPQCRKIMVRRVPDADLTTTSQWPLLVAAQEEDMASLEVTGLVEKSDEGAGDGGREAAAAGS
jgi:hypothetical protein